MSGRLCLLMIVLILPVELCAQDARDTSAADRFPTAHPMYAGHFAHRYPVDSTFSILFDISTVFYTTNDTKIDNFLTRYGYVAPQPVQVGINFELAAIPFNSKMMYSLDASTIVSRQAIKSTTFMVAAYRQFFERRHFWISGGIGAGIHESKIYLNGKMPPSFDSLANLYSAELVMKRSGFELEPAVRFFWYPLDTRRFQLGLFAMTAYYFSFNSRWKLGYYSPSGQYSSFKDLSKKTGVQTHTELGWALSDGLSFRFKLD